MSGVGARSATSTRGGWWTPPAAVLVVGVAGLVAAWWPAAGAVARLVTPPGTQVCPAVWPPVPACAPGLHVAVAVLASVLVAGVTVPAAQRLRRSAPEPVVVGRLVLVAATGVVAVVMTARPRPLFALLLGLGGG